MKRDMELVRLILLKLEADVVEDELIDDLVDEGYSEEQVGHHVWLMKQAGLVVAHDDGSLDTNVETALPISLLPAGHDLIDDANDPGKWRARVKKVGGAAVGMAMDLGTMGLAKLFGLS